MNQEEMAVKLAEVDSRSKSNTHRINELSEQIDAVNRLATAVEVMATEQKHQTQAVAGIKQSVSDLDAKVEAIEKKPAKRWDGIVEKFVSGLVGAFAAALAAGILYLLVVAA
ncbi:MAG: hypothetical protein SOR90_10440 [Oscillospiraceae bacterium]|nr:hypothetical protein [Oscillospiraceae bacterium]